MPRRPSFNPRRAFRGNQFSKCSASVNSSKPRPDTVSPRPNSSSSASSRKLTNSKLPNITDYEDSDVNIVVNLQLVSNLLKSNTKCKYCDKSDCVELQLDDTFRNGLESKIIILCTACEASKTTMTSKIIRNLYEVNVRFAYALRSIGKGVRAAKTFCAVMNLPPPTYTFQPYYKRLLTGAIEVCNASLFHAAQGAITANNGNKDIAVAVDGTWQKRGHTSLNGVITATSFDTGKVLDFECLTKYCACCSSKEIKNNPVRLEEHKKNVQTKLHRL